MSHINGQCFDEQEEKLSAKYKIKQLAYPTENLQDIRRTINELLSRNPKWKKEWVDDATLRRFLAANKNIRGAEKKLVSYFNWRLEQAVDDITTEDEDVQREDALKRAAILDIFDYCGHPIMIMFIRRHDKHHNNYKSAFKFLIEKLETLGKLADCCLDKKFTLIFDMKDFTMRNMDYQFVKTFLRYLTDYYPDRLYAALIVNSPGIVEGCWKIIKVWMNDAMRSRFIFGGEELIADFLDTEKLPVALFD